MVRLVFAGPSLSVSAREKAIDAGFEIRHPARRGDLAETADSAGIAVLIDGYFDWTLSVSHTEIKYATEIGCAVYGAASIGALRAAETSALGMIGVGEIFRRYLTEEIVDDDEVALLHFPQEIHYLEATLPMINLRVTLERLVARRLLTKEVGELIAAKLKKIFYAQRDWTRIQVELDQCNGIPGGLGEILKENYINQKHLDAEEAIDRVISDLATGKSKAKSSRRDKFSGQIARYCALSGLDDMPEIVVSAVRAQFRANPISMGSGASALVARNNALAEALEFEAVESPPLCAMRASYREIADKVNIPPLHSISGFRTDRFDPEAEMDWVPLHDLLSGRQFFLPYSSIAFSEDGSFSFTTNGMGASASRADAVSHAIEEILERHIVSTCAFDAGGFLRSEAMELFQIGDDLSIEFVAWLNRRNGRIAPFWIENDFGVNVFMTFLVADCDFYGGTSIDRGRKSISVGYGCSKDVRTAFRKSLKESVQTRLAYISGARPGLSEAHYKYSNQDIREWISNFNPTGKFMNFGSRCETTGSTATVEELLILLKNRGAPHVLCYEFKNISGKHIIKILVPNFVFNYGAF